MVNISRGIKDALGGREEIWTEHVDRFVSFWEFVVLKSAHENCVLGNALVNQTKIPYVEVRSVCILRIRTQGNIIFRALNQPDSSHGDPRNYLIMRIRLIASGFRFDTTPNHQHRT